jgi:hypothetical protein
VKTGSANVLVDCGLFQGARKVENRNRIPNKGVRNFFQGCAVFSGAVDRP